LEAGALQLDLQAQVRSTSCASTSSPAADASDATGSLTRSGDAERIVLLLVHRHGDRTRGHRADECRGSRQQEPRVPAVPVSDSEPLFTGAWIATWLRLLSMSNSVVPVLGLRSLLVYAAIVIPVAGVGGVQLSVPSTVVMPPGLTSCAGSGRCRRRCAGIGGRVDVGTEVLPIERQRQLGHLSAAADRSPIV
jgi:hypothetical protein